VFDEQLYTLTPCVDLQRCNGCGACQVACPTQPRKAIVVRPMPQVGDHRARPPHDQIQL